LTNGIREDSSHLFRAAPHARETPRNCRVHPKHETDGLNGMRQELALCLIDLAMAPQIFQR
jgi:hypothetical protein